MPNSIQSKEIIAKILEAKTAVVVAHLNPDGDTLGSMLAIAKVLEQAGVERVDRIMHDEVPEIYRFFPDQEKVLCSMKEEDLKKTLEEYDLSFSLDCGSVNRLGSAGKIWQKAKTKCNIDHHLSNPLYGDLNWVDAEATCTGQVVKEMADDLKNIQIDKDLASLYYITLLTDTGGFRHSNTNSKVFTWASELVNKGADPNLLFNNLFNQVPFRAIKVIGDALDNMDLITIDTDIPSKPNLKVAYTTTSRSCLDALQARDEDTDEIVDHIMRIKDIDMCIYLREGLRPKSYKGSLRSAISEIDCSLVASKLNGGGHARAAGFNMDLESPSSNFEELKAIVIDLLRNYSKIQS